MIASGMTAPMLARFTMSFNWIVENIALTIPIALVFTGISMALAQCTTRGTPNSSLARVSTHSITFVDGSNQEPDD